MDHLRGKEHQALTYGKSAEDKGFSGAAGFSQSWLIGFDSAIEHAADLMESLGNEGAGILIRAIGTVRVDENGRRIE